MKSVITSENARLFAYVNEAVCVWPIRGLAVDFMGLCGQAMLDTESPRGKRLGAHGLLYVSPYLNLLAWMNPQAVAETDEIIPAVLERCGASDFHYNLHRRQYGRPCLAGIARYARRTHVACIAD